MAKRCPSDGGLGNQKVGKSDGRVAKSLNLDRFEKHDFCKSDGVLCKSKGGGVGSGRLPKKKKSDAGFVKSILLHFFRKMKSQQK